MATILRDALRGLRSARGTNLLGFGLFALAIAVGTVTFSVVDAIALRRLPFPEADRLIAIPRLDRLGSLSPAAPQDYFAWLNGMTSVESLGMYRNNIAQDMQVGDARVRLSVARITANFFSVLRVRPVAGQLFEPAHDVAGGDAVVVLSHALWVRVFSASPSVVGQMITLGATPRRIVGVLEAAATYPVGIEPATDAYIPTIATAQERSDASGGRTFNAYVVGRLRPGATVEQAQHQVDAIDADPRSSAQAADRIHVVQPLLDYVIGPAQSWLLLALAAVACVVLVACVNVAGLFLARAMVRMRELATREILGASRRQIAVTLLVEGLLLSLAAGLAGVGLAAWGVGIVKAALPAGLARASAIALDARVLSASGIVVIVCGVVFASAPAWMASRLDLFTATRAGGGAIGGRARTRALRAFLVGETAFVSALLVATMLAVTSFVLITTSDLGFDRHNVMAFGVQKSLDAMPEGDRLAAGVTFRAELIARVSAIPGVTSAVMIKLGVPFVGGSSQYAVGLPDQPSGGPMFALREVTPGYFATMGLRLVRGRAIAESDRAGTPRVAVINEIAAQQFFPGQDPLNKTLTFRGPLVIIGVVRAVRNFGPEVAPQPELYVSLDQSSGIRGDAGGDLVVRSAVPMAGLAPRVRQAAVTAVGAGEVFQARFLDEAFARRTAGRRFNAAVMAVFGAIALIVGAIGIYGTVTFVVAQDVRAIGLRLALGAAPGNIRRMVLADALRRVGAGIVIGLAAAWSTAGWLRSVVFGVQPTHPAIYAAVATLLAVVACAAALLPAVRASRLDPLAALRRD
jgi:predicted permease